MLTKKQLEDARHCKHCSKCEMYKKKEKEGYLPIQKYCQKEAARAALAYREMLEKVTKALAEATEVISEQLDIVNEEDLALIVEASILLGESEGRET
jgi:cell division protein YceG involved in septum cleavage